MRRNVSPAADDKSTARYLRTVPSKVSTDHKVLARPLHPKRAWGPWNGLGQPPLKSDISRQALHQIAHPTGPVPPRFSRLTCLIMFQDDTACKRGHSVHWSAACHRIAHVRP